jgi:hypothetical protein
MLPALYVALHYAAIAGIILATTAFFMTWARASPASPPGAIERMLATNGAMLAMLLAIAHVALANGLGMRASDYLRYVTLPLPTELRRMLLVAVRRARRPVCGDHLEPRRPARSGRRHPVLGQCRRLMVTALCGQIGLAAGCWSYWLRFGSVFARVGIVPAAVLIWQFHVLRSSPHLPSLAAIEAATAIVAGGAAWPPSDEWWPPTA